MLKIFTFLVVLLATAGLAQNTVIEGKVIRTSERWSGTIIIEGDVVVNSGARLVIDPGTHLLFRAGMDKSRSGRDKTRSELIVRGVLIARGTISNKIRFSSAAAQPRMGDWQGITIMNPRLACIIDYCIVEYAYNGLNIKKSAPKILNSQIQYNYNAGLVVELRARPNIVGNIISENGYAGMICNTGAAPVLTDNMITRNEIGIINFSTARPNLGDLTPGADYNPGRNGILDNREFNIHNHSSRELKAENVSWGSKEEKKIKQLIFDADDNKKYGAVDIIPILGGGLNLDKKILLSQTTPSEQTQQSAKPPVTIKSETQIPDSSSRSKELLRPRQPETQALALNNQNRSDSASLQNTEKNAEPPSGAQVQDSAQLALNEADTTREMESQPRPEVKKEPEIDYNKVFLDALLDKRRGVITKKVAPVVNDTRRGLGAHGRIIVQVIVGKMGRVESARVLRGLNPYYDQLAVDAAKQFIFEQGTIKGNPVRFSSSLIFKF